MNRFTNAGDSNLFSIHLDMQIFPVESRHISQHYNFIDRFVNINIGTPDAFVILEGRPHQMKNLIRNFLKFILKITAEINFYVSHFPRLLNQFLCLFDYNNSMTTCKYLFKKYLYLNCIYHK